MACITCVSQDCNFSFIIIPPCHYLKTFFSRNFFWKAHFSLSFRWSCLRLE